MKKWNKRLILLLVLVLVIGVIGGCSNKLPDGIENKTFLKDMNSLYGLVDKSIADRGYYGDDIRKVVEKIDATDYFTRLNDYEKSIFELAKEVLVEVESDLTTGKKMIQSHTFDKIETIWKMLD